MSISAPNIAMGTLTSEREVFDVLLDEVRISLTVSHTNHMHIVCDLNFMSYKFMVKEGKNISIGALQIYRTLLRGEELISFEKVELGRKRIKENIMYCELLE